MSNETKQSEVLNIKGGHLDINEAKEAMLPFWKALKVDGIRCTPLLWGGPGCGKTTGLEQFGREQGLLTFTIRPSQTPEEETSGVSIVRDGVVIKTPPSYLAALKMVSDEVGSKGGLLIMDEINRASKSVVQQLFSLLLEGKMADVHLGNNVMVVATANPDTGEYKVMDFSDPALADRFCHLRVMGTNAGFAKWHAERPHTNGPIAKKIKGAMFNSCVKSNLMPEPTTRIVGGDHIPTKEPTDRSKELACAVLGHLEESELRGRIGVNIASGILGEKGASVLLTEFINMAEDINIESYLKGEYDDPKAKVYDTDGMIIFMPMVCAHITKKFRDDKATIDDRDVHLFSMFWANAHPERRGAICKTIKEYWGVTGYAKTMLALTAKKYKDAPTFDQYLLSIHSANAKK
jgi:AAA domain (dynein-related subfamily)